MKFDKAVIYRIVCKDPEITDCYVGSTTDFIKRKCNHKYNCINEESNKYNLYVYKFIRDNGGWDNWQLIEVCKANECTTKQELETLERQYLEQYKATLNKKVPTMTRQEYYEKNKDKIIYMRKIYAENNKDKLMKYSREYREENKEYLKTNKKEHYEAHKEDILLKNKLYRKSNKEAINARKRDLREQNKDRINARRRELRQLKKQAKEQLTE